MRDSKDLSRSYFIGVHTLFINKDDDDKQVSGLRLRLLVIVKSCGSSLIALAKFVQVIYCCRQFASIRRRGT